MRLLVSGSTRSVADQQIYRDFLGVLAVPKMWGSVSKILETNLPWAIDNGAFAGFSAHAFMRLCLKAECLPRLLWVACPDVVGNARDTLRYFHWWSPALKTLNLPVAFVSQDGADDTDIPWNKFECLFIGGTTKWKLSQSSWDLAREARQRGKLVHMGRVNSFRRMKIARLFGCDSVDGTAASKFGDVYIPKFCRFLAENISHQPTLFDRYMTSSVT